MYTKINSAEEVRRHKNYNKDYDEIMPDVRKPSVVENIANHLEPAKCFDEMFTPEELTWIYGFAFSRCGVVRHNANGTIFVSGNLEGVYKKFKKKIDQILPGAGSSPVVGGNFFITPSQYGLHNDSMREDDWAQSLKYSDRDDPSRKYVPWRNVIIPIMVSWPDAVSHAVFFKQRHIDWSHVYNNGGKIQSATTYKVVDDHSTIDFYTLQNKQSGQDNLKPYDKEHYNEYLSYTPYERLSGLEPELTCEWKPGCPIVFDAFQLHATNKGYADREWNIKMGLLLCFLREVK